MPVFPTTELEMVKVLMLRLLPLTEVTPREFPPLWYQVTVGVGIPDTSQVKVTVCSTSFSRSLEGDTVILGGAVLRQRFMHYIECDYREEAKHTLNSDGGLTWVGGYATEQDTAHLKCHTVGHLWY